MSIGERISVGAESDFSQVTARISYVCSNHITSTDGANTTTVSQAAGLASVELVGPAIYLNLLIHPVVGIVVIREIDDLSRVLDRRHVVVGIVAKSRDATIGVGHGPETSRSIVSVEHGTPDIV